MKRILDVVLTAMLLLLLLPVMILTAAFILAVDGLPILYRQERVGKQERPFWILKFRTMEDRKHDGNNATVTTQCDPRLIAGARIIRAFKLDELPQFLNILKGDMSLVGPRPTVVEDYRRMTCVQRQRFAVRPGLTGLAQVSGNTALNWHERIKLDLEYIGRQSWWLDVRIMLRTFVLVATGKAETHPPGESEWDQ